MQKVMFVLILLFGVNLFADFVDEGFKAYVKRDYKTASKLYKKACDTGNYDGCSKLGALYEVGQGVSQNYQKAIEYGKKACDEGGLLFICGSLGDTYEYIGQKNRAKKYYGKACDGGFKFACKEYKRLEE